VGACRARDPGRKVTGLGPWPQAGDRQADEREAGLTRGIIIAIMPQCAQTVWSVNCQRTVNHLLAGECQASPGTGHP